MRPDDRGHANPARGAALGRLVVLRGVRVVARPAGLVPGDRALEPARDPVDELERVLRPDARCSSPHSRPRPWPWRSSARRRASGPKFVVFALIVLTVTLFLGVATFVRLVQVNNEDIYWVAGMNRLRGQYAKLEPGIEDEFVTGITLDTPGFAQTYAAVNVTGVSTLHMFVTTPGVVGILCAVLAGVVAGLVALQLAPMAPAIGIGIVAMVLARVACS